MDKSNAPHEVELIEVELIKEVLHGGEPRVPGEKLLLRPDQVERLLAQNEIAPLSGAKPKRLSKEG